MDPTEETVNNEEQQQPEQIEQVEEVPTIKKKELSQKQIDHLNAIRVKALDRKREIKLKKNEEYKKQAMEKKVQQVEIKQEVVKQEVVKPEVVKQEVVKPEELKKKKVVKKVIKYIEADDDESDEEEIIITKPKKKDKQVVPVEAVKQAEPSYSDLLYNSSLERLQTKLLSERAKSIVHAVIPNYY